MGAVTCSSRYPLPAPGTSSAIRTALSTPEEAVHGSPAPFDTTYTGIPARTSPALPAGSTAKIDFAQRTAIVTGAAHGFGRAIALGFAARGASVWACDVQAGELAEVELRHQHGAEAREHLAQVGRELGLPEEMVGRHPFPGPGLAIRILGEITGEGLEVLRRADHIYIEEIRAAGLYDSIWQAFAVLLPIRSVGVQGDFRTYDQAVALRAVTSRDGMTADWYAFPPDVLGRISSRIANEVKGVNRVVYDVSSKPPSTIEWE